MKINYLLLLCFLLSSCKRHREVNTSFYYWKTVYKNNKAESKYLDSLHARTLYVRIMDVEREGYAPEPVAPIMFKDSLPAQVQIIPVVYITNKTVQTMYDWQFKELAKNIAQFVDAKVKQAGKQHFAELQVDCDWTATTRDVYFKLLKQLKEQPAFKGKIVSVTLRLHQLKNLKSCGIPPVSKVMLMCYNMGNLRKYGPQNSILDLAEMQKYAGDNLKTYPLKMDIALPLFSWAVAYRNGEYIGLSKSINQDTLNKHNYFSPQPQHIYLVKIDLPQFGLNRGDEVKWETVPVADLERVSKYLSPKMNTDTFNISYFHLDENLLKTHPNASLEKISNLWR